MKFFPLGGAEPPLYIKEPHRISETIRARKLECYKHLGKVKYSCRIEFFSAGACKDTTPYCILGTPIISQKLLEPES